MNKLAEWMRTWQVNLKAIFIIYLIRACCEKPNGEVLTRSVPPLPTLAPLTRCDRSSYFMSFETIPAHRPPSFSKPTGTVLQSALQLAFCSFNNWPSATPHVNTRGSTEPFVFFKRFARSPLCMAVSSDQPCAHGNFGFILTALRQCCSERPHLHP